MKNKKNNLNYVAIIEARMTSSRLPGKVLKKVLGKPLLYYLIERLKRVECLDDIVIATTNNTTDDVIEEFALQNSINFFRGSEQNVMQRVLSSAEYFNADVIVEITGDCPLIDIEIVEQTINMFKKNECEYCANRFYATYPIGMDVQVFYLKTLKNSYQLVENKYDKEHVTSHIIRNPKLFPHTYLIAPKSLTWPELVLAVDEQEDFDLIERIITSLYKNNPLFNCLDIITLLKKNTNWIKNSKISRNNPMRT